MLVPRVDRVLGCLYGQAVGDALGLPYEGMSRRAKGKRRAAKAGLNRAILDSGMLRLRTLLAYKMPLYGGKLIEVPAAYTSRTCSRCGARNNPGASKIYSCANCGLVIDRDRNASLNILAAASCSAAPVETPVHRGAAVSRGSQKTTAHAASIRSAKAGKRVRGHQ